MEQDPERGVRIEWNVIYFLMTRRWECVSAIVHIFFFFQFFFLSSWRLLDSIKNFQFFTQLSWMRIFQAFQFSLTSFSGFVHPSSPYNLALKHI